MDYKLAKELKDAGFPLKPHFERGKDTADNEYELPTLSELIEACGDSLIIHGPGTSDINENYYYPSMTLWTAFYQRGSNEVRTEGSTPEEAVARLWLALNKKTV